MQFEQHHWTDPANITATELNRIEQGIKNSLDVLNVLGTELANAQSKQTQLTQLVEGLVANSPSVLETLSSIQRLLDANPTLLTTISSTANVVTKDDLVEQMRSEVIAAFQNVLNELGTSEHKTPVLELPSNTDEIKKTMDEKVFDKPIRDRGLQLVGFAVESVTLDDDSSKKIDF